MTLTADRKVCFALEIPQPGFWSAKIYVDPAGNLDDPANPTLAATINFAVLMPTPVPTPKSGTPSGSPGVTPSPSQP